MCKIQIDGNDVKTFTKPVKWDEIKNVVSDLMKSSPFLYVKSVEISTTFLPEDKAYLIELEKSKKESESPELDAFRKKLANQRNK